MPAAPRVATLPPSKQMKERRELERHAIRVPVQLDRGLGITRDLSTTGAYFYAPHEWVVGSTITFGVALSELARNGLSACCRGVVVRTERTKEGIGIAVRIEAVVFESFAGWQNSRSAITSGH
jgi:signal transduction histidine kinase